MKRTRIKRSAKAHERKVKEAGGKLRYFDLGWDGKSVVPCGVPFGSPEGDRLLYRLIKDPKHRVFFWQATPSGPLKIGRGPRGDTKLLTQMRGKARDRPHILAVMPANIREEAQLHRRFAHLLLDPAESLYRPDDELLLVIAASATPWLPNVGKNKVAASCERCGGDFDSSVDCRDRFCPKCQKLIKASLSASGYLQPLARPTWIKPDNYGSDRSERKGEPNPWQENAVRELEEA